MIDINGRMRVVVCECSNLVVFHVVFLFFFAYCTSNLPRFFSISPIFVLVQVSKLPTTPYPNYHSPNVVIFKPLQVNVILPVVYIPLRSPTHTVPGI